MINNCDEDEYDGCEGYKTDDVDHHVGSDYFDGGLALCIWFVVVIIIFCGIFNWLLRC